MRAAAYVFALALTSSAPAFAQDAATVRAALSNAAAAPTFDRERAVELATLLARDGLTPEDAFLLGVLAEEGEGRIKIPFKDGVISVPRPTYDAQRLMERLLSPLDLTRLWLKGPESMSDLRDLARLSPAYDERIKTFIARQFLRAWEKGSGDDRADFIALYGETVKQFVPYTASPADARQAKALLDGAIDKAETQVGVAMATTK